MLSDVNVFINKKEQRTRRGKATVKHVVGDTLCFDKASEKQERTHRGGSVNYLPFVFQLHWERKYLSRNYSYFQCQSYLFVILIKKIVVAIYTCIYTKLSSLTSHNCYTTVSPDSNYFKSQKYQISLLSANYLFYLNNLDLSRLIIINTRRINISFFTYFFSHPTAE